jgi:hypothetical protein
MRSIYTGVGVLALAVAAGCQGMYDGKAQHLKDPDPVRPPKGYTDEPPPADLVYNTDPCVIRDAPQPIAKKGAVKHTDELTGQGDEKVKKFDHSVDPKEKTVLIKSSLDDYRKALVDDPFSAEATMKLAVAYDKVLRKSCALALLGRLSKLAENPKYSTAANARIDEIVDHDVYFHDYRNDAIKAVGR